MDVFLPNMIDDVGYLEIFHKTLLDILETRRPDLIVFVSGADIFEGDRLGKIVNIQKKLSGRDQALFQYVGFGASVATLMAEGIRYRILKMLLISILILLLACI